MVCDQLSPSLQVKLYSDDATVRIHGTTVIIFHLCWLPTAHEPQRLSLHQRERVAELPRTLTVNGVPQPHLHTTTIIIIIDANANNRLIKWHISSRLLALIVTLS